jgi:hypothetical protein
MRTIHLSKYRYAAVPIFVALSFAFIGRAYAWETTLNYAAGLAGAGGSAWAPGAGNLNGDVWLDPNDNFRRKTQPYGSQSWNANEMNWIKANSGRLSITFHSSYHGNTGPNTCDNGWTTINWAGTNQPGGVYTTHPRNCFYNYINEVRISGDKSRMSAGTWYWAQSSFTDDQKHDGQFNVDTYWDSNENYHQKYCVLALADRPGSCSW